VADACSVENLDLRLPLDGMDAARLLAAVPEAVLVVRDGEIAYTNERAVALIGRDPTGDPPAALVEGWRAQADEAFEGTLRTSDDVAFPVQVRLTDLDGATTVAVLGDARALLAARQAEAAQERAEAKYRSLVEQIPAVVYADEGGAVTTYVSPQIEHILGVTPEAYKGDPDLWLRMIHPDDRARVQQESDAFLRGEGGDLADYRMVRPDGRVVWIRDRAYAHRDGDGRVVWEHGILFDVTELKEAEERIAYMAFHDALTGLANRALFEESLGLAIERAKRTDLGVAVLFLDLDNFKDVNDSLGHHAGDDLLVRFADRLQTCTRDADLVARQGGDEFLMLLGDLAPADAVPTAIHVAQRIEAAMADPFHVLERAIDARGSIGISLFPRDAQDAASLMRQADAAMYRAKRSARGEHVFWAGD